MKRLLLLVLVLCLCVVPVLGVRANFQDYNAVNFPNTVDSPDLRVYTYDATTGQIIYGSSGVRSDIVTTTPVPFTYIAFDTIYSGFNNLNLNLLDSNGNVLSNGNIGGYFTGHATGHIEVNIVGGTPMLYQNGVLIATTPALTTNPTRFYLLSYNGYDNIIYGEADHHVVGALPINYTIQRDLLNPASLGVYAWSGTDYVAKNSHTFYLDANKEGTENESVVIKDFLTQTVVNTTYVSAVRNQIAYNISEFLNTPTSLGLTLPDGMYTVSFSSSPAITDSFWVTSSGAVVSWDKTTYAGGDSAIISYVISPSYFTSDYTYKLDVINMYGTVVNTQVISAASGTKTISNLDATTYPPGVYYAVVRATTVADGTVHDMAYSPMETIAYVLFDGYVMNAENGNVLSGASINLTQGTSTLVSTSGSGGIWNSSNNWASGMQINITTQLAGYTPDVRLITPLSAKSIALNISLVPSPPTNLSHSIGGVVRDNVYGNPVTGATVYAKNVTNELTNTTNIAGYYRHDELSMSYDVWANKTGYANSSTISKNASLFSYNRTDLVMYPSFSFTGNIVDSVSHSPIPIVNIIDSNAWTTNTTTGTFTNTYNYSVVVFYLSSSGYDSKAYSYIIDSNRTETMELTLSTPSSTPIKNTWYTMQLVQITIVDNYGNPIPTANLSVRYIASTLPSTNKSWLTSAFGVDDTVANEMTDSGVAMQGITSDDGSLTFMMFPALTYGVTISDASTGMSNYVRLSPKDTSYVITCPLPTQGKTPGVDKMTQLINSSLYISEPNTSFITWNLIYQDTSGYTTGVTWNVTCWNNMTEMYTRTYGAPGATGIIRDNYTFPSVPSGVEYRAMYSAVRSLP